MTKTMTWNTVSWDRAARRARLRAAFFGLAATVLLAASGTAALADRVVSVTGSPTSLTAR